LLGKGRLVEPVVHAWELLQCCYNRPGKDNLTENIMADDTNIEREADGMADAIAVTAIIAGIVLALCIWLQGMPS